MHCKRTKRHARLVARWQLQEVGAEDAEECQEGMAHSLHLRVHMGTLVPTCAAVLGERPDDVTE